MSVNTESIEIQQERELDEVDYGLAIQKMAFGREVQMECEIELEQSEGRCRTRAEPPN